MKQIINNIRIIALAVVVASSFASCNTLDQTAQSSFDAATVYSNSTLTRYNVNSIYLAAFPTEAYRCDFFLYFGLNTDVETVMSKSDNEISNICRYDVSPTNTKLNYSNPYSIWVSNFKGIERANICVKGLEEYGNIDRNPEMGALYGEALTARSMLYLILLDIYGEVCARFEPITNETKYLPKSDRDVIYKQILSDLEKAADYMSYSGQTVTTKCGKALARGLYARAALQASGYSLRPDEGKVNTGDEGTIRLSNDPELQKSVLYPKALAALQDVIDNSGLSLYDNFEDMWHDYCNLETAYGKEVIFAFPLGSQGNHIKRNAIPDSHHFSTSLTCYNGVPSDLYFKFDKEDTRRDVTCYPAKIGSDGKADGDNMTILNWYYGKFRLDWMEKQPMTDREGEDCAKFTYMRYADILLMASEIANELGDLSAAKNYMKPVLDRAFHNDDKVNSYLASLTSKETFFDAIVDQRGFEFAGELLRQADLVRWNMLKSKLDECAADLQDLKSLKGRFTGMNDVIYYRYKANGIDLELYGTDPTETENKTVTDPNGGWKAKKNYFSAMPESTYSLMYVGDPDKKMYRPIPAKIITSNVGVLVNDYGYTF